MVNPDRRERYGEKLEQHSAQVIPLAEKREVRGNVAADRGSSRPNHTTHRRHGEGRRPGGNARPVVWNE